MNRDDDFTRSLEAWLRREAPPQAPDRVLEAALARVDAEPQRLSWQQRLFGTTTNAKVVRMAALTAVVVLAVVVGQQLSKLVPDVGDNSPSPSIRPSLSTSPTSSPPTGCINPPTGITTLIDLQSSGPEDPAGDPVACYGDAALTIDATWYGGGVADCQSAPEPAWLACSSFSLQPAGDTRRVGAPQLFVAVDPSAGLLIPSEPFAQVRVTGHYDDPTAQSCHETAPGAGGATPEPAATMIELCRRTFVVTEVVPADLGVPHTLAPNAFAQVIAGSVNLREQPAVDAPNVTIYGGDAPPIPVLLGTAGGSEHVYVLEGPVLADGFEWYRVAPIEYEGINTIGPPFVGWMASGDGVDPWLVVEDIGCPGEPITLEDVTQTATTTNWATRLGCFRGQELTFRGWFPDLPPDVSGECAYELPIAFLMCTFAVDIRPIEMSFYDPRNADRLDFVVSPDSGLVISSIPRGQWIEITGHWDDPASALCPTDTDLGILSCRIQFVVNSVTALGADGA